MLSYCSYAHWKQRVLWITKHPFQKLKVCAYIYTFEWLRSDDVVSDEACRIECVTSGIHAVHGHAHSANIAEILQHQQPNGANTETQPSTFLRIRDQIVHRTVPRAAPQNTVQKKDHKVTHILMCWFACRFSCVLVCILVFLCAGLHADFLVCLFACWFSCVLACMPRFSRVLVCMPRFSCVLVCMLICLCACLHASMFVSCVFVWL